MKENRKLLREVLNDIRHDMTDEEVLNLLADSKISVKPESGKENYTLGQRAADTIAKFAGSWAFIFSFTGVLVLWMVFNVILATKAFDPYPFIVTKLMILRHRLTIVQQNSVAHPSISPIIFRISSLSTFSRFTISSISALSLTMSIFSRLSSCST